MRNESFSQQPYLCEIHQDRLAVLVDATVAGVHVGLDEHKVGREQCVRLAQNAC